MHRSLTCAFITRYDADKPRREFIYAVKNCRTIAFGRNKGWDGRRLAVHLSTTRRPQFSTYLSDAILVPVPPSGAGVDKPGDTLWPSKDLANLLAQVYGLESRPILRRHTPIEKSSSGQVHRNLRRQVESLELLAPLPDRPIVLIDDFVTTGSTICGCAEVLLNADPSSDVKGFAVAYSPGDDDEYSSDFAARQYEWDGIDGRPRNRLVPSPLR